MLSDEILAVRNRIGANIRSVKLDVLDDWATRVAKLERKVERLRATQNSIVERAERILEGEKWNLAEFVVRETKE